MPLTNDEAKRLAEEISGELQCDGNARTRVLCLVEVLRILTDAGHALSIADLQMLFEVRFGVHPAENTLRDDISRIAESGFMGLQLVTDGLGTRCVRRSLSTAQVRLLVDMLRDARDIGYHQSMELQEMLRDLVSFHERDDLAHTATAHRRLPCGAETAGTLAVVDEALRSGHKLQYRTARDAREHMRVGSPIRVLMSGGVHFLELVEESGSVFRARVDSLRDVAVVDEPALSAPAGRMDVWGPLGSGAAGKPVTLFLLVERLGVDAIRDEFGAEAETWPHGAGLIACVHAEAAAPLYGWIAGIGARIADPRMVMVPRGTTLATQGDDLIGDYLFAAREYKEFLRAALADGWDYAAWQSRRKLRCAA